MATGSAKAKMIAMVGLPVVCVLAVLIPMEEGVVYQTYRDPVGIISSCMGHTGPELKMGQRFTKEQCDEQMWVDLVKHAEPAMKCSGSPFGPRGVAAIDFAYNKGVGNFCRSTFAKKLAARDPLACDEPLRWVYADNGRLDCRILSNNCYGLVKRAVRTKAICSGDLSGLGVLVDFGPDIGSVQAGATP